MKTPGRRRTVTLTQRQWDRVLDALCSVDAAGTDHENYECEMEADRATYFEDIAAAMEAIGAVCRPT